MTSRAHSLDDVTGVKLASHTEEMRFVTVGLCSLTKHICSTKSAIAIQLMLLVVYLVFPVWC
jgi:hypothetical protein